MLSLALAMDPRKDEAPLAGMRLNLTGMKLNLKGMRLNLKGMKLNLKGMKLNLKGMRLKLTGMRLKLTGMRLNLTGMRLNLKRMKVNLTGMKVNLTGMRLCLTGMKLSPACMRLFLGGTKLNTGINLTTDTVLLYKCRHVLSFLQHITPSHSHSRLARQSGRFPPPVRILRSTLELRLSALISEPFLFP